MRQVGWRWGGAPAGWWTVPEQQGQPGPGPVSDQGAAGSQSRTQVWRKEVELLEVDQLAPIGRLTNYQKRQNLNRLMSVFFILSKLHTVF